MLAPDRWGTQQRTATRAPTWPSASTEPEKLRSHSLMGALCVQSPPGGGGGERGNNAATLQCVCAAMTQCGLSPADAPVRLLLSTRLLSHCWGSQSHSLLVALDKLGRCSIHEADNHHQGG